MKSALPPFVAAFSRFLGAQQPQAEQAAILAALAVQAGHVCADLACDAGWGPWAEEWDDARRQRWRDSLSGLDCVGGAEDWTPLVWDGRRLYLRRYFDYERALAADLRARSAPLGAPAPNLEALLTATFPDAGQRAAARIALTRRLTLISGGPGTGKTHTLARIIGLLQQAEPRLRIALAAPTGKAAARMGDALAAAGVVALGGAPRTLHRLLGAGRDGARFERRSGRPLAVDVLVVDEASMIDLALMGHLIEALPAAARLILLGDRDQLAAVEAGAVFADLCDSPALAGCVAPLATRFRFGADSSIARCADALRSGAVDAAVDLICAGQGDLAWRSRGPQGSLVDAARSGYRRYREGLAAGLDAAELWARFEEFRVLCAHRQDAAAINCALTGVSMPPPGGTPLLILRNDARLQVFNGDIALLLPDPADGRLKVWLPGNPPRRIELARLPEWEPAWAMTVHKAQGSEFGEVLLVLPEGDSPAATRELVYTGLTRARRRVSVQAETGALRAALARRTYRMSGLRERLSPVGG